MRKRLLTSALKVVLALTLSIANAQVSIIATYYHAVPWQTDSRPWEASCGRLADAPGPVIALSRDLFFRENGSKRCGEWVMVRLNTGHVIVGVVWDTMARRFRRRVDILVPNGVRPEWGKQEGVLFWLDGNTG